MLLLGIDVGTSFVKATVVDAANAAVVATAQHPETEAPILAPQPGWAEQRPEDWWSAVQAAILKCHASGKYNPADIAAIGIAYQMHGLVLVDQAGAVLRPSIIWCDSRAIEIGEEAFAAIGKDRCRERLLNSPGNFTASKLAWVKQNEPDVYNKVHAVLLPGDYIALKFTGVAGTTPSALSEGIFWDFQRNAVSQDVMQSFGFDASLIPHQHPAFGLHGDVSGEAAALLQLRIGIPVSYKAGDQPNNALSLNALQPGEVAATAGTSGVIYGVSDALTSESRSRINSFAHVNHTADQTRIGVLLCINGCGSFYRWVRQTMGGADTYDALNSLAAATPAGAAGVQVLPFGNGAERMLGNRTVPACIHGLDLNVHTRGHVVRAAQEGIAFAFRYGLDIMRENGMNPAVVRAGHANLFRSPVFTQAFVAATGLAVELYSTDGSWGAAMGAGIGAGIFASAEEAFAQHKPGIRVEPVHTERYNDLYNDWKELLESQLYQD